MLMVDEASVRLLAENFLKGNYSLDFAKPLEAKN